MTRPADDELIAAFAAWDAVCSRWSATVDDALAMQRRAGVKQPRAPHPPRGFLEAEAPRLTAAERAVGLPLGWCGRVGALRWREDGTEAMDAASAVQAVLHEHAAGTLHAAIHRVVSAP